MTGNPFRRVAWLAFVIPVLALLLAMPATTLAQRMTAELNGTVVDESGGVIPGADVVLINEDSRTERRSVTNADGFFAFAAVPAGTYTVQISLQGFSTYEVTAIPLNAGDSRSLRDLPLKVAALAETVSVTAEVQLTPLNSGEKSTTLTSEVIENIPIVSSSAAELLRVLPGMTPITNGTTNKSNFTGEVIGINGNGEFQGGGSNNQSAIGNYSANGTSTSSLDITIDGAPGADPGCNCATSVNPNTEMVQEFKVLSSSFGAEYAKGPNSMTVVTKSGGRDFHGSAFLYYRDYHLNSNEWFANKIEDERVKNSFVYPGFTLSGPISIGNFNKDRDKLFFFVGFEYYRQRLDTGYVRSWVPTPEMKAGDFNNAAAVGSGGFVNTPLNDSFPGGVVPGNMIDPGGQVLLNLFPSPNANPGQTGGWNYVDNLLVDQPNRQLLARVDWNISDSTKMFVRYNYQRETQPFVIGLWWRNGQRQLPYPSEVTAPNQSDSITASLTHVFDPTLTSETIFAYTYIDFPNQFSDRQAISRSALGYPYQGVFGESNDQIPSVDPGGWGDNGPLIYNPGGFDPILFATKWQYAVTQNFTKVWGTHTAKLGLFWERIRNAQPGSGDSNGRMFFSNWAGTHTGNTFADLLTGQITAEYGEQTQNVLHDITWDRWEAFVQDSWKLNPSFTLNYGARLSYFEPWKDNQGNGFATWYPERYDADVAAGRQTPGVYWNAIDSDVPLSGVDTSWYVQPRIGFAWDVRGTGETVLRGGGGMYLWHDPQGVWAGLVDLPNGLRSYFNSSANFTIASLEGLGGGDIVGGGNAIDKDDTKQPKTYTWSLTLNQRLPWSLNLELGYVGNRQNDQNNNDISDINMVPLGAMTNCYPDCTNNDDFRPLGAYQGLTVWRHWVYTNYHGLQALLARQRGSFNFTLAYTFSKTTGIRVGDRGPQFGSDTILSPYRNFAYGPSGDDRTHVATGSFSWLLPEPNTDGAMKYLLGGWQLAGIVSYVSGAPLPYVNSVNFSLQGTNEFGDSIDSRAYSGSPDVPVLPVITCDPRDNTPDGYMFNPACFALPELGTNGNYNMPYMKGQAYWNLDLSVFKNFDLGGDKKLQLRLNAYNALNHPIAYPDVGTNLTMRFENGVLNDPNFGRLPTEDSSVGGANKFGRRIIQLAVRFTF
jgi:hypothetical protein